MGQSMASYYNPSAAYGSISAASLAAAAAAQQSMSGLSAGPPQVKLQFIIFVSRNKILGFDYC